MQLFAATLLGRHEVRRFEDRHLAPGSLGGPLPGLTPEELQLFNEGKATFEHEFTIAEGRGPLQGLAAGLAAVRDQADLAYVSSTDVPLLHPAFVRAVVSEHTRTLMWGARGGEVVTAAVPDLSRAAGVSLNRMFVGDDRLTFVGAEPVYIDRHRGIAIHYRDVDGHLVTYMAVPAQGIAVPDRERVQVDRWRPALLRDSGFAAWLWRQGDIACLIVSDMVSETERDKFKDYFVRVRKATEPILK